MKKLVIPRGVTVYVTGAVSTLEAEINKGAEIYAYTKPKSEHLLIDVKGLNVEHIVCDGILYCGGEFTLGVSPKFDE